MIAASLQSVIAFSEKEHLQYRTLSVNVALSDSSLSSQHPTGALLLL